MSKQFEIPDEKYVVLGNNEDGTTTVRMFTKGGIKDEVISIADVEPQRERLRKHVIKRIKQHDGGEA